MTEQVDTRAARRILQALAQSGQPPKLGASLLNVGTDDILKKIQTEFLEDYLLQYDGQDGGGGCKWVEADYGNGKTQFLRCVQERAWNTNYATAFVELSQDECPLDRPDRIYGAVARSVQAKPLSPTDVDRSHGFDIALQQLLDRMFPNVLTGMPDEQLKQQAEDWINNTLGRTAVESNALLRAACQHLLARLSGNEEIERLSSLFLRGEPLPTAEVKAFGVYEKLDKSTGFRFLRTMCQILQRSGLAAGSVLLFDEARRSLSLMSTKSQKVACENLLSVINRCNNGELPGTLFIYAVMPEFFTDFATAYPALQQRCGPSTRINLNHLQNITESDLLMQIGEKICHLFQTAYASETNEWKGKKSHGKSPVNQNMKIVAETAIRKTMGSGTRRLFVKTWIQVLNDGKDSAPRVLAQEEVEAVLEGAKQELKSAEAQQLTSDGE